VADTVENSVNSYSVIETQKIKRAKKDKFDKTPRFVYRTEKALGPGEYYQQEKSTLTKKTFNIQFLDGKWLALC